LGRRQEALQELDDALAMGTSFSEAEDARQLRARLDSQ
jgi:hypothetical protein